MTSKSIEKSSGKIIKSQVSFNPEHASLISLLKEAKMAHPFEALGLIDAGGTKKILRAWLPGAVEVEYSEIGQENSLGKLS